MDLAAEGSGTVGGSGSGRAAFELAAIKAASFKAEFQAAAFMEAALEAPDPGALEVAALRRRR